MMEVSALGADPLGQDVVQEPMEVVQVFRANKSSKLFQLLGEVVFTCIVADKFDSFFFFLARRRQGGVLDQILNSHLRALLDGFLNLFVDLVLEVNELLVCCLVLLASDATREEGFHVQVHPWQ